MMHLFFFNASVIFAVMFGDYWWSSGLLLLLVFFLLVLLMQGPVDLEIEKVLLFDDVTGRVDNDVSVGV